MTGSRKVAPLAARYLLPIHQLPEPLRVRRPLEREVTAALESGQHICIRGFWRIGKTELMKAALGEACQRTGGSGFVLDLRDEHAGTPTPPSPSSSAWRATWRTCSPWPDIRGPFAARPRWRRSPESGDASSSASTS